jgi:hypothetical protein
MVQPISTAAEYQEYRLRMHENHLFIMSSPFFCTIFCSQQNL